MPKKLLFGECVNDSDDLVFSSVSKLKCEYYKRWYHMLIRCYSKKYQEKMPTYIGCTVCEEWKAFSNFKEWMKRQDWQGKHLDKDIIVKGNKIYSPETCAFVEPATNTFTTDGSAARGGQPIGVSLHKRCKSYDAHCRDPFLKKLVHLGCFSNPIAAHEACRKKKHELACRLAENETDERVAKALRTRYLETDK
jgi:hypothetical protein